MYTSAQKKDCVEWYIQSNHSIQQVQTMYAIKYGDGNVGHANNNIPSNHSIIKWYTDMGHFAVRHEGQGRPISALTPTNLQHIEHMIQNKPKQSQRDLRDSLLHRFGINMSLGSVNAAIHKLKLHPYRMHRVQLLTEEDPEVRMQFAVVSFHPPHTFSFLHFRTNLVVSMPTPIT